jgi:hypothetical protein
MWQAQQACARVRLTKPNPAAVTAREHRNTARDRLSPVCVSKRARSTPGELASAFTFSWPGAFTSSHNTCSHARACRGASLRCRRVHRALLPSTAGSRQVHRATLHPGCNHSALEPVLTGPHGQVEAAMDEEVEVRLLPNGVQNRHKYLIRGGEGVRGCAKANKMARQQRERVDGPPTRSPPPPSHTRLQAREHRSAHAHTKPHPSHARGRTSTGGPNKMVARTTWDLVMP